MPAITAPFVETQPVVTGIMYQVTLNEEANGTGITRIEFGPYFFPGPNPKYPEPVTNELAPSGWSPIRWVTEADGASWLRYEGGNLQPEDGEVVFRFTSNFPPSTSGPAHMIVWRGSRKEDFDVPVPDYTQEAIRRNSRHDCIGQGSVYKQWGCFPQLILGMLGLAAVVGFLAR
ncbi:MAG TPA: hypothetical protein VFW40_11870 [Capsulimonadaceae bacterium]|nr:hypothetical protein [Capsulimonadaceae bacterium]